MTDAKQILHEILTERQSVNPSYSLRAFARDIRISPQQLSNVITGRRGFSPQTAERVASDLKLDARKKELFVHSLKAKFAYSKTQKAIAQAKWLELTTQGHTKELELELFNSICNWYHLALIGLIRIYKNKPLNAGILSRRLGLPETEVQLALGRLERLDLISRTPRGWKISQDVVIFDRNMTTEAIKKFHRQLLEKAIHAMAFQSSDERYGSSSTLPIKVKNLDRAKKLIQKFRSDFAEEVTTQEDADEIYGLTIQFFRLTQPHQDPKP